MAYGQTVTPMTGRNLVRYESRIARAFVRLLWSDLLADLADGGLDVTTDAVAFEHRLPVGGHGQRGQEPVEV